MRSPDAEESVRCTVTSCSCVCFKSGSVQLRTCDRCGHGWVSHALAKLHFQAQPPSSCGPVEVALPGLVFDLSSLVLYGAQAVPVRLKILLDRLYSILTPEQVGHILHTLGWSLGDYVRGYMLQHPNGKVLDRWLTVTPEEELLILKQFLRFGETRPIVELMTLQCLAAVNHQLSDPEINPTPKSCQSNVNKLGVHRNGGRTPGVFRNTREDSDLVCRLNKNSPAADHNDAPPHFENFPGGPSLLLPFHFPSSALHCLVPPTKELVPPSKLTQCIRKLSGTKLGESYRQDEGRREQENDLVFQQSKVEWGLKVKADPDKPNQAQPIWHNDQEVDLHRVATKQENTSSISPSLNSSLIPTSSPLYPSISSSSPKISQKLPGPSSYSLNPLPSFSSSFLCPLTTSSFSSSLHPLSSSSSSLRPLPSSLCSLPSLSPAGGRKGRVCCGVCGKSFYDKGTLKIHYNAVHLKIKHRCTVAGCTMVFSSLRSRNRHSANPNPRLHTGTNRDGNTHRNTHTDPLTGIHSETQTHKDKNAEKDSHSTERQISSSRPWQEDDDAHMLVRVHALRNGFSGQRNTYFCRDDTQANSPPPSPRPLSHDTSQNFPPSDSTYRPNLHPQAPPPPPLVPARSASSLGSPPSLIPLVARAPEKRCRHLLSLHADHTVVPAPLPSPAPITNSQPVSCDCDVTEGKREETRSSPLTGRQWQWESGDPVPKKKPRKSSMPVKIEREKVEGPREEAEVSNVDKKSIEARV
ncbi:zinc finger protein basonuclin-2-like [Centropristis striata]|uniref:zinc finger protein basonuclin-2-like n=1 Tax=Centropristis striata TaxID=184440 RepID=UPI0027E0F863|nr:zinc finger protein basonuclin-2-like [Centropristis striata]